MAEAAAGEEPVVAQRAAAPTSLAGVAVAAEKTAATTAKAGSKAAAACWEVAVQAAENSAVPTTGWAAPEAGFRTAAEAEIRPADSPAGSPVGRPAAAGR